MKKKLLLSENKRQHSIQENFYFLNNSKLMRQLKLLKILVQFINCLGQEYFLLSSYTKLTNLLVSSKSDKAIKHLKTELMFKLFLFLSLNL